MVQGRGVIVIFQIKCILAQLARALVLSPGIRGFKPQ